MSKAITIDEATANYLQRLEEIGKSASTCGTTGRTLKLLVEHLGEKKQVGKILPVHVSGFFKSEAATIINGRQRAPASVEQIRRIVRQFLIWAQEQGLTDKVAVPKQEMAKARAKEEKPKASKKARPKKEEYDGGDANGDEDATHDGGQAA